MRLVDRVGSWGGMMAQGVKMSSKPDVEFIQPPDSLRSRVSKQDEGGVNFSATDQVIQTLSKEFVARLPEEFSRIEAALAELEARPDVKALQTALFILVHDLKGQAGTFDYMLLTVIGNDLCRFTERLTVFSPRCLKVMRFHVEAMKRVFERRMTGDGDGRGQQMVDTLHSMTRKVLQG